VRELAWEDPARPGRGCVRSKADWPAILCRGAILLDSGPKGICTGRDAERNRADRAGSTCGRHRSGVDPLGALRFCLLLQPLPASTCCFNHPAR